MKIHKILLRFIIRVLAIKLAYFLGDITANPLTINFGVPKPVAILMTLSITFSFLYDIGLFGHPKKS